MEPVNMFDQLDEELEALFCRGPELDSQFCRAPELE